MREVLRLCKVVGCGAPEEQAAGHATDRDGDVEFSGDAEDAVFHRGEARPLREREAGGGLGEGRDFVLEGEIQCRVHPRASAHRAGFC